MVGPGKHVLWMVRVEGTWPSLCKTHFICHADAKLEDRRDGVGKDAEAKMSRCQGVQKVYVAAEEI